MILFCDTSALMKLLVDEAQSDQMRQISNTLDAIGVCRISWAEVMAALARLQREDPVCNIDLEQARQHLIQSWKTFTIVEVSQPFAQQLANPLAHQEAFDSLRSVSIRKERGVAQLGSAGALGALGRRFESCRPD